MNGTPASHTAPVLPLTAPAVEEIIHEAADACERAWTRLRAGHADGEEARLLARVDTEIGEALLALADARRRVKDRLAHTLGRGTHNVDGLVVRVTKNSSWSGWDNDALRRAVLDSRAVDPATGEVLDETPYDRIVDVYALGGGIARRERLRARGIDPHDFATVKGGEGYAVSVERPGL